MKRFARTMLFWLGIIVAVIVCVIHPWFPGNLLILLAVGCCAWQYHHKVKEMKKSIAEERSIRAAADRFIQTRVRKG